MLVARSRLLTATPGFQKSAQSVVTRVRDIAAASNPVASLVPTAAPSRASRPVRSELGSKVVAAAAGLSSSSSSSSTDASGKAKMEVATLGGGCFWCIEACYNMMRGVQSAISGYAAGKTTNPDYKQICTGTSGHAEVVQITYDPAQITYKEILQIFFTLHDPTTKDRQGNDVGTQYRSIILTHNEAQKAEAEQVMAEVAAEGWWPGSIVTQVEPLTTFYPAEDYHQNYFVQNPGQGYCRAVVGPKVAKFRSKFGRLLK
ncbi:Peptide methionine sulfoxide reductase MsrA [Tetrabaena socialis]|uniref:peptide-methionine (S)-S-oxide reductase n=1 Tax=Tetrabaena socialis TaxID=47790 RepID=A0A2J8AC13_9CHLO|nr:Peptide methionine sulfoxide reductase MsrA [Tetrabaena socialis]|eukprot:PNH10051.1 Peptide methionine sulfoxide reductase MsrA [Tetrabaena socialis]